MQMSTDLRAPTNVTLQQFHCTMHCTFAAQTKATTYVGATHVPGCAIATSKFVLFFSGGEKEASAATSVLLHILTQSCNIYIGTNIYVIKLWIF